MYYMYMLCMFTDGLHNFGAIEVPKRRWLPRPTNGKGLLVQH